MSFILDDVKILYKLYRAVCVCVCVFTVMRMTISLRKMYGFLQSACPEECPAITYSLVLAPSLEQSTWQARAKQVHVDIMIQAMTRMFKGEPYR